ncbi:hypothetical protein DVH24_012326 [Malus domestica]|uniref:Uncharacterized protein n=1 Tax=Malus domestica TaxID=3750 RepID=A0A498HRQ7_MALDO|nr:hypothetical protein DVH24_012326 [Malus domestica]
MKGFGVQPEKSTISLVADAWRSIGLTKEANRMLGSAKSEEKTSQVEKEEEPFESLEKTYQKKSASAFHPNLLQIPSAVTSDQKGSATRKGRMVLRDGDFLLDVSSLAAKFMNLSHICKFEERSPNICRQQFQGQLGVSGRTQCTRLPLYARSGRGECRLALPPFYEEAAPKSRTRDLPLMGEGTCHRTKCDLLN